MILTVGITSIASFIIGIVMLFLQSSIIAWALHKLNPSHSYRGQEGLTRLIWHVFEAQLLAALFLTLSFAAVAFGLSRMQCIPFYQAQDAINGSFFWQPLYFLVTTVIQIILIKIPAHVSKVHFVSSIALINLGIITISTLLHKLLDILLVSVF